jgi:deazaflavin-dependent oxidoreductase (nitroreductase family)
MRVDDPRAGASPDQASRRGLSWKERIGLFLHRGLDRWLSPLGVWVFRRTKGAIAKPWKVDALLLTTRGRRTGQERTVVLQYFRDGTDMVITAANDGGRRHPGWYFNLEAEPSAQVEIGGRRLAVRAEILPSDEAAAWWGRIVGRDPTYERYERATTRRFPIIRLTPLGQAQAPQQG